MWSERWGESGMRSIEMKQNSGGQRDTEQWHSCEWQRLGDQSGEYSRGGGVCFWCGERRSDTSSAGVTEDYRLGGLQSTPAMTSADDARLLGCLNAVILKVQWFRKKKETISLLLAGSAKDTIAEQRQWITTLKNKLLHFHLCKLNQFGLLCCISHS